MNTITTPNFMGKIEKLMAEIRNRTFIEDVDAEVIKKILQDELEEECRMLDCYYWEEYYNELYSANSADGNSENHSAV